MRIHCDAKYDAAGIRIGQHGAARNDRTRYHHSGCSGFCRKLRQSLKLARGRMPREKQPAGAMDGPAGVKKVAGTGTEQTRFHSGNQGVAISCDAKCDAISTDRLEVLARAVVLVAGVKLADAEQAAVLARVIADLTSQRAAAGADPPWPTTCSRATS